LGAALGLRKSPRAGQKVLASAFSDVEQLVARQHDQSGGFDPHGTFALEALELLVDALS
jgi:hypothetical protein